MPPIARRVIQLAVTAGALAWLLHVVPFETVLRALRSARPDYVIAGLALQILMRVPAAMRMKAVADAGQLGLSLRMLLSTLFTTSFYGLLLPGGLAGGTATWLKYVQHGARGGAAIASIIVNRSLESLTLVVTGIAWWLIDARLSGVAAVLCAIIAVTVLIGTHVLLFSRSHYLSLLVDRGVRWHWLSNNIVYRNVRVFSDHLAQLRGISTGKIFAMVALSLVQDLLGASALYCLGRSLNLDLGFFTVAWLRIAVQFVVLLPISFSGLGVRESTLVFLTAPFHVAAPAAVAWSFLIFAGTLVAATIGALIEALNLWLKRPMAGRESPAQPSDRAKDN